MSEPGYEKGPWTRKELTSATGFSEYFPPNLLPLDRQSAYGRFAWGSRLSWKGRGPDKPAEAPVGASTCRRRGPVKLRAPLTSVSASEVKGEKVGLFRSSASS